MKAFLCLGLFFATLTLPAQEQRILERGPHHQRLERLQVWQDEAGITRYRTNRITQLADSLCYLTTTGWELTQQELQAAQGGFFAGQGPLTLFLNENLNVMNALDITATDGAHFEVSPAFVALRDATGQSVLLAAVQDSVGRLIAPNVVLYDAAFDSGLDAAIRVSYTRRGIEQDLVLFDPSNQIQPENFGLIPASTTIELWSEMTTSPQAQIIPVVNDGIVDDIVIHFGSTKIAEGKAFSTEREDLAIRVLKRFGDIDGRRWLVEQISYAAAQPLFDNPQGAAIPAKTGKVRQVAKHKAVKSDKELVAQAPARKKVSRAASLIPKPSGPLMATAEPLRKGFVLDFQLFNTTTLTNMRFFSDSSYEIAGLVTLSGTTVMEPGVVLKYTNAAKVKITGPVIWLGAPWRPVVMTAIDDTSVGEVWRTNTLTGYYADTALELDAIAAGADFNLQNLRISYATTAIKINGRGGHVLSHAQIVNCGTGIVVTNATNAIRDILLYNVTTPFNGSASTLRGEHLTIDAGTTLNGNTSGVTLLLTNSLVTGVTTTNGFNGSGIVVLSSSSGVYESAGAGSHYLPKNSPYRNTATATINSQLASELKKLTTSAPRVLSPGYLLNSAITYNQTVQRDTDTPDYGAHYFPIDYAASGLVIANGASVTIGPGVVMAGYKSSPYAYLMAMDYGGKLSVQGNATDPAKFIWHSSAQELSGTSWQSSDFALLQVQTLLTPGTGPQVNLQFADFVVMGSQNPWAIYGQGPASNAAPIVVRNSQVHGGQVWVSDLDLNATNNLMERVAMQLVYDVSSPPSAVSNVRNGLHWGGSLMTLGDPDNAFSVRDTIFYQAETWELGGNWDNGYNGYHTNGCGTCGVVTPTVGSNQVTTITFLAGALGNYYLPTNSVLVDKGSVTNASTVGFSFFTTDTNQVRETTTRLDIGFHSVATASATSAVPLDTDGDGIPDYMEDANGNGTVDTGETDFNVYNSTYGIGSGPGLVTFTPFK